MKNKKIFGSLLLFSAVASLFAVAAKAKANPVHATSFESRTTQITGFAHSRVGENRQRLIASLSAADWGETPIERDTGSNAKIAEYNYHTNVEVNGKTIVDFTGWNTRCIFVAGGSKTPKLYFDISHTDFAQDDVITFKEGTQIPSFDYVVNGGPAVAYTLDKEISFSYSGIAWSKVVPFDERSTNIASVSFETASAANHYCYMKIKLTSYDYTGGAMEDSTWTKMTSFKLSGIKLNGSNIVFDAARKDRYRAANSTVILNVYSADGTGSEYTSIEIPAGTEFPSKAYHDSGELSKYVVSKDTKLVQSDAGFVEGTSADLIVINRVNETRLRLGISLTNYDHDVFTGDVQKETYPTAYPIFSSVLVDGVAMERWTGMTDSRVYFFKGTAGPGFDFKVGANVIPGTIVVKAGTLFASYYSVEGGVEKYYVLTEDVTFKHDGSEFLKYGCVNTLNKFANDFLKMNSVPTTESGTGLCASAGWYADAKEAYGKLNDKDKALFVGGLDYADAVNRLKAWAEANGEEFVNNAFVFVSENRSILMSNSNTDTAALVIIIVSVVSISSLCLLVFLKKKRSLAK